MSCAADITDKARSYFLLPQSYDIGYVSGNTGARGNFSFNGEDYLKVEITQSGTLNGYVAEVTADEVKVSYKGIAMDSIGDTFSVFGQVKDIFCYLAKGDYILDTSNKTTLDGRECAWCKLDGFTLWFSLDDYSPMKIESDFITLNFFNIAGRS